MVEPNREAKVGAATDAGAGLAVKVDSVVILADRGDDLGGGKGGTGGQGIGGSGCGYGCGGTGGKGGRGGKATVETADLKVNDDGNEILDGSRESPFKPERGISITLSTGEGCC